MVLVETGFNARRRDDEGSERSEEADGGALIIAQILSQVMHVQAQVRSVKPTPYHSVFSGRRRKKRGPGASVESVSKHFFSD